MAVVMKSPVENERDTRDFEVFDEAIDDNKPNISGIVDAVPHHGMSVDFLFSKKI